MRRGFTLIELAIVLILVGIVIAVTLPLVFTTFQQKKIAQAEEELKDMKDLVITYYVVNDSLPAAGSGYTVPYQALQIPQKYTKDPIRGIPFLYYADRSNPADSIYVDGTSIGSIGAVLISAGVNGKFDGENASPSDGRFQSQGSGDFDDILVYISELELTATGTGGGSGTTCTRFTLVLTNSSGANIWVKSLPSTTINCERIKRNRTSTFTDVPSGDEIYIFNSSTLCSWGIAELYKFSLSSTNQGNDCEVCVIWNGVSISADTCASP